MGDPKKFRKKYQTRRHPWKEEIIKKDKRLTKEYSLKNKREVWSMDYILKRMKDEAKRLIAARSEQGEKEKEQLLKRLMRYGLITEPHLEKVLDISVEQIADRRLQSLAYAKKLARSMKQARQFIVHGHISIGSKKIAHPNYLVTLEEEQDIRFNQFSPLVDEEHPERNMLISQSAEEPDKGKDKDNEEKKRGDISKEDKPIEADSKEEKRLIEEEADKTSNSDTGKEESIKDADTADSADKDSDDDNRGTDKEDGGKKESEESTGEKVR